MDVEALADTATRLSDAFEEAKSVLANTSDVAQGASPPIRGEASAAWAKLLEDWQQQNLLHSARGEQLVTGLSEAAKLYKEVDSQSGIDIGQEIVPATEQHPAPSPDTSASPDSSWLPDGGDTVRTPYGDLGKWMRSPDGSSPVPVWSQAAAFFNRGIASWTELPLQGGQSLFLHEPVNMVLVDGTSKTPAEAQQRLIANLEAAGFHQDTGSSSGYSALLNGKSYDQAPPGVTFNNLTSDHSKPYDHGRFFGPVQSPDGSYVWTGAVSKEKFDPVAKLVGLGIDDYVSFQGARDVFTSGLASEGAVAIGMQPMGNSMASNLSRYVWGTGDHDGKAAVMQLR
ncbi:MAG: hypothetical protein ACRC20_12555 [Segniliparus sp.]|uniref:hypothetical protein n=1 Tax=Segniliparus sp. TaxID=2804064 RepID=UPI003F340D42